MPKFGKPKFDLSPFPNLCGFDNPMPRAFVPHPCFRCSLKPSVQGMRGFCSQACRTPSATLDTPNRPGGGSARGNQGTATRVAQGRQPRNGQTNEPVGHESYDLYWFSVTFGKGGTYVEMELFALVIAWFNAIVVRGCCASERGKRDRLLHFQMAVEIRAPAPDKRGKHTYTCMGADFFSFVCSSNLNAI